MNFNILLIYKFQEATLNTLVFTEVLCWFFIGECIGKGSIVGYQV
jgi:F-type H+-transporting ATPase subunit g